VDPVDILPGAFCDLASSGTCYRNEAGTWTTSHGAKRGEVVAVEHWLDEGLRKARQP